MPADLEPLTFQLSTGALRSMTNELWDAIWMLGTEAAEESFYWMCGGGDESEPRRNWDNRLLSFARLLQLHPSYLGV